MQRNERRSPWIRVVFAVRLVLTEGAESPVDRTEKARVQSSNRAPGAPRTARSSCPKWWVRLSS